MSNVLRFRLVAALFLLVALQLPLFGQLFRNLPRRAERQPAVTSPADAIVQMQRLTSEMKASPRKITENDLNRCQRLLLDAVNDLQRQLPREFDRATANDWSTTFKLAELRATLGQRTPNPEILEAVQAAFLTDKEGIHWMMFDGLRTALRRYQTIALMLEEDRYERRLTSVCDNLVGYIETYSEGRSPLYFVTLSNAAMWLEDISLFDTRAARLAELTRSACSGVNVRLQVGNDFVAAGFVQDIEQEMDIDEVILGTKVIGSGTLSGTSSAELVASTNRATIKVIADAMLETLTEGTQRMVTLNNHTTGTLRGEKQILFAAEGITTAPARSRANLDAQLSDVQINARPLVQRIARNQIEPRSADSIAEASRRAERQMNAQMNELIDSNIAQLNEKYQRIRTAAIKAGLFPRVWNLSSTTEEIDWSILLGNNYQPSAPNPAPAMSPTNGLAVQVHQSSLNNMLTILLAGRFIDEERFAERIGEFLDEVPEFLQPKADETPARVSFDGTMPVDVMFVDNKIRVVVRLTDIQVMNNAGRSFTITVEYQVKMENGVVVLEQTTAEAFPTGFRPDGGVSLSAAQTVIRSYLMRRLEVLPKRQEAKALDLGGEWSGKGQLIPQFASTEKGWLTFVWNWQPAE
ncbi:MAG: hypothetical protein FWE95_01385 [Planctomycetaceae bacterium]|nr:hypothetical protein [Planctomycetaceae bacterium]